MAGWAALIFSFYRLHLIYKQDNYVNMYDLHNTANLLPLKLRREIVLLKIMFSKIQDRQGLQLRELTTRAHDGPIMNVSKRASSRYTLNQSPTGDQQHGID